MVSESDGVRVGALRSNPPSEIAQRVVDILRVTSATVAVTIDPDGVVWIERPEDVAEDDLVGVYAYSGDLLGCYRNLREDLLAEKASRQQAAGSISA